jgi:hypothetical protein
MEHERAVENLAVESYLLSDMTSGEREAFEEHYFECAICAEDLRAASQFLQDAKEVLAGNREATRIQEVPKGQPRRWTWPAWQQPQFATALVAIFGIVAAVETFRQLLPSRPGPDNYRANSTGQLAC